ncbi:MAG: hypothetical protein JJ879_06825 [Sneathiella sp.]|nr:hypothetical protein [Sneathiella sp.]
MKKLFGQSLAIKQAKTAAIAAIIVGLLFSAAQLGYDFILEKQSTERTAHHILNTMSGPASEASYNLSGELAEKVLSGVMENPQVRAATLYALFGSGEQELLSTVQRDTDDGEISWLTAMIVPQKERYRINLTEGSTNQTVGIMEIELDPNVLANNFLDRAKIVFTAGLLRNISLTFILLFAFYNTLTKPISNLSSKVRDIDIENPESGLIDVPKKHAGDELGTLIKGVNNTYKLLGENLRRRREAEREIRDSMYMFQALARSSSDIFWQTDTTLNIGLLTIDETTDLLNRRIKLSGSNLFDFLRLHSHENQRDAIEKAQKNYSDFRDVRVHFDLPEGTLTLSFYGTARHDKDGNFSGYLGTAADISEAIKKDLEIANALEQLRQSQKMEAVGQLTGGVAHDFNNLLAVIIGNLELVEEALEDRPELNTLIKRAILSGEKGAQLTQQLLAFSRKQSLHPQHINVNDVVRDLSEMLKRTFSKEIDIQLDLSPNIKKAYLDPTQLENALLNLCINARDAMPEGGRLTVRTESHNQEVPANLGFGYLSAGQFVKITVSDTGNGMSSETLKKAMEPFFTTKEVGKGSGMGLAMVYGFVGQSQGAVHMNSIIGEGTSIELFLPLETNLETEQTVTVSALTS